MKTVRIVICLAMVLLGLAALPGAALADGTPPESLAISVTYPRMETFAGSSVTYEVQLSYTADNPKVFDLQIQAPTGWEVYFNPQGNTSTKISSVRLDPAASGGASVNVVANVPLFPIPNPGDYKITFTATSGTVKASTELTAVVTPRYSLILTSETEQTSATEITALQTTAQAGKDDVLGIKVQNLGTAAADNITFSSTRPNGWTIDFSPGKVDSLTAFNEVSANVTIRPDAKAVPGDYVVSLSAAGAQAAAQPIDVRVTVVASNIWVWVQLILALLLVAGLILLFVRSNRR